MPPTVVLRPLAILVAACVASACVGIEPSRSGLPDQLQNFVVDSCLDCHDQDTAEGGLDLSSLGFDLADQETFDRWVLVHDRIRDGEMPPSDDSPTPIFDIGRSVQWSEKPEEAGSLATQDRARSALHMLATRLASEGHRQTRLRGRAKVRRLNRYEYENTLRSILQAPWLQVATRLPEDGIAHLFNKVGERLDVSHVQMAQYLSTARHALRRAVNAAAHPSETRKLYAREESSMQNYLHYRFGQRAATRAIVPLVDLKPEIDVIRQLQPPTVGDSDPGKREREAMGVFSGVYSATTKYDFERVDAPIDGRYRIALKTYTFMAGPNGADGGDDHGLTGGQSQWWRPDRKVAFAGARSEPVTLYALSPGGDSRWLTTFDSHPEPSVFATVVTLRQGEGIRPDAARLVRTRPGWTGNPNATPEGVPGLALNWLEVQGPLNDQWPPASYQAVFADLPFQVTESKQVIAIPSDVRKDAQRLLSRLYARANWDNAESASVAPYVQIFDQAIELGENFTDAMISAMAAMLCSPEFLYFETSAGQLSEIALKQRLAYFLWNGPADRTNHSAHIQSRPTDLHTTVEQMLDDPRSDRFVNAFLDYWLDLRDINANTPDAELYPDYYLDELLTESSLLETRLFFRELIDRDLSVRHLVDSDFTFVNERLAEHYGFAPFEGVELRRVRLPADSIRGGLLTQASVLRVTANGTTTSPVLRGVWVAERILGMNVPPPPSGVSAVEPDIRGAKTIREQLAKHREVESCNSCHKRIDPAGFALESFDVAGGLRSRYRSVGDEGDPVAGFGKNGHAFRFKLARPIDCSGVLSDGRTFRDVRDLKRILARDVRQLARNLVYHFVVYSTGAPVEFSDRAEVEAILDRSEPHQFGVRTLIHEIVQSDLFTNK